MSEKKLAKLTKLEDAAWGAAMAFYLNEGLKNGAAAERAWADLQEQFPRLKAFDGARL
jgi:hypothetical protein